MASLPKLIELPYDKCTIIVFSDSHGAVCTLEKIIANHPQADFFIHLGDYCKDAAAARKKMCKEMIIIKGNNDYGNAYENDLLIDVGGVRIFCTHGHNHWVQFDNSRLSYRAEELKAQVALYGHTHISNIENNGSVLIINPGSIALPRGCPPSYAIIEIGQGKVLSERIIAFK